VESGERPFGEEVLRTIDGRLERLEREAQAGSVFAAEARDELRITRVAYGQQIELTRQVIERNAQAFDRHARAVDSHARAVDNSATAIASWEGTQAEIAASMTAAMAAMVTAMNELREEVRAQTRAIFRMLDRLGDDPTPA
jgi:chromosome segregation ATPase